MLADFLVAVTMTSSISALAIPANETPMAIETAKLSLLFRYIFMTPKNEFLLLPNFKRLEVSAFVYISLPDNLPDEREIQIKKLNPFIIFAY